MSCPQEHAVCRGHMPVHQVQPGVQANLMPMLTSDDLRILPCIFIVHLYDQAYICLINSHASAQKKRGTSVLALFVHVSRFSARRTRTLVLTSHHPLDSCRFAKARKKKHTRNRKLFLKKTNNVLACPCRDYIKELYDKYAPPKLTKHELNNVLRNLAHTFQTLMENPRLAA